MYRLSERSLERSAYESMYCIDSFNKDRRGKHFVYGVKSLIFEKKDYYIQSDFLETTKAPT